jgi:hypothetical protein
MGKASRTGWGWCRPHTCNLVKKLSICWSGGSHDSNSEVFGLPRATQKAAAKVLGVTQPRVSDLLRGRFDLFSTDALIDMVARMGARVRLSVKVRPAA